MRRLLPRVLSFGAAALAVAAACLMTAALRSWLKPEVSILFFPAVTVAAIYGGVGPGLLASGLACVLIRLLFPSPGAASLVGTVDVVRFATLGGTALLGATVAARRDRAESAHRRLSYEIEHRANSRTADTASATRALESVERQQAIGRMAGAIAHDFNNSLTVIIGNGELLARELPEQGPSAELLADVQKAAARAASLTRQLLAYSGRQRLQPRNVSLNDLVENVRPLLARLLPGAITLRIDLAAGLPLVHADPTQIEQVILNLAVNASDAMPTGGTLTLATATVHLTHDDLRHHPDLPPGSYVCLTIADTGSGMDPATASRAFEPFFTTRAAWKWTGLGLSTAYGIVKQSGGEIWFDTALGAGTTFRIHLPIASAAATRPPAQEERIS